MFLPKNILAFRDCNLFFVKHFFSKKSKNRFSQPLVTPRGSKPHKMKVCISLVFQCFRQFLYYPLLSFFLFFFFFLFSFFSPLLFSSFFSQIRFFKKPNYNHTQQHQNTHNTKIHTTQKKDNHSLLIPNTRP